MAQVEFGIISIVGKNVVESELNYNFFCSIFDVLQIFGFKF